MKAPLPDRSGSAGLAAGELGGDPPNRFELRGGATALTERAPVRHRSMVRPYTRTGGRTRSGAELALEALVSTSELGRSLPGTAPAEHRQIADFCADTRSVAEIAANLALPLGVVKVFVGDMAEAGLVLIHQPGLMFGDRSSREFMERVLDGLRSL
ncbi:DUF742 domain-containing protein [Amycolatopsis sp. CA-230715]|uniref:DUF742 domain-containing protein n=1 Tax=Amycolatopsis sp. CA-230715 TaxID=2745196 RepID=UPI001C0302CC|nr:hypothetical protein HUW46_05080 [Amycolatopsis sp. CA-230715]